MQRNIASLAALALLAAGGAQAAALVKSQYNATGTVASTNGAASCAQVGLVANAPNHAVLAFPGNGKKGLIVYVPVSGVLQLCSGFPAIPSTGLDGFSASVSCNIDTAGGNIPTKGVVFSFTQTVIDSNSAIGSTTVTIPKKAAVGAGCSAVIDTTTVRSGV